MNIKHTMDPHNAVKCTLRQRLTVQSAAREAAQEDGDDRLASFEMTQSGQTIIFPSLATAHTAQAGPAPYAFARGLLGEAEEASRPGFDSGSSDFVGECEDVEDGDGCQIDVCGRWACGRGAAIEDVTYSCGWRRSVRYPSEACSLY